MTSLLSAEDGPVGVRGRERAAPAQRLVVRTEAHLTDAERTAFEGLDVFSNFAASSTPSTQLFYAKVYADDRLVGLAPGATMRGRRVTDLLRPRAWRLLGRWGGPLVRRTIVLLDTAFRAYDYASPFLCRPGTDHGAVADAVCAHLRRRSDIDVLWIAEPSRAAHFTGDPQFASFPILPMIHVETGGATSLEAFVAGLSKKRRRNYRHDRAAFTAAGATLRSVEAPLEGSLATAVLRCLGESAQRSALTVPYADVLNDPGAFARQPQTVLLAEAGGEVIGFFGLVERGETLSQIHGGFDYERSLAARAYHNLIYAAIELAIRRDCRRLSMGPLNNETKRRCGTDQLPVVASVWNRGRLDRFFTRRFILPRLQVRGEGGVKKEGSGTSFHPQ